jgi:hypothetical protein
MSISALSSNLVNDVSQSQRQNPFRQLRQDFNQRASALQSGNLSTAQTAYSNLQQLLHGRQTPSNSNTGANASNTIQNDFSTLGQVLQSGDITQAQSAFSQLQSDIQAARQAGSQEQNPPEQGVLVQGHHPHHGRGSHSQSSTTASQDSSTTSDTGSSVSIYA